MCVKNMNKNSNIFIERVSNNNQPDFTNQGILDFLIKVVQNFQMNFISNSVLSCVERTSLKINSFLLEWRKCLCYQ